MNKGYKAIANFGRLGDRLCFWSNNVVVCHNAFTTIWRSHILITPSQ
ncbi:hypothetical protein [Nodularia sp. NIES-3585]|nr:hypothetical protein [Nodularia sp. NIES-3585]